MGDAEKHARKLIKIMKDAGTNAGEIMMFGQIQYTWLKPDGADPGELMEGLQFAGDNGWVEQAGNALRLTAKSVTEA